MDVRLRLRLSVPLLAIAAMFLAPEAAYLLGALAAPAAPEPGNCAVLVLGFPTGADGAPSGVQRYRVEAAVDVFKAQKCALMVLAGGPAHNSFVEGETMAGLAIATGVPPAAAVVEGSSRNTWENIAFSLPFVEKAPRVYIVSDPLHMYRGKRYWCRQRPDLCDRAIPATRYRPLRLYMMKWLGMSAEIWAYFRDKAVYESRAASPGRPATQP